MKGLLWILALLITCSAAYYQRVSSPTYPSVVIIPIEMQKYPVPFLHSHTGKSDCPIILQIGDISVKGELYYRKYPSQSEMTKLEMKREGDKLVAAMPNQSPGVKVEYRVDLFKNGVQLNYTISKPTILLFEGEIPKFPFFMNLAVLGLAIFLSTWSGLLALFGSGASKFFSMLTFISFIIGGFIIAPIVHKYAVNDWWTGFPIGYSLNNNKFFLASLVWLVVVVTIQRKYNRIISVVASLLSLLIFLIPSTFVENEVVLPVGKAVKGFILPIIVNFISA